MKANCQSWLLLKSVSDTTFRAIRVTFVNPQSPDCERWAMVWNYTMTQGAQTSEFQRVAVVGTSCVGKTTFARKLSTCLGVWHIELDALFWQPEWVERPVSEFQLLVEQKCGGQVYVWPLTFFNKSQTLTWPWHFCFPFRTICGN